ncbi:MAG: hypothetical protein ABI867_28390 [Kofleriaceae bacterium]
MTERDRHVSDLRWDRLLAGDLTAETREAIETHAAGCAQCAARMREITAGREAFTLRPRPFDLAPPRKRSWWWGPGLAGLAAVAASVIVMLVRTPPAIDDDHRAKGGSAHLLLSAGAPGRLVPLAEGDVVHPGDYVQAGYTAEHAGFGAVLSLDGVGTASAYVPSRGYATVELPAGTERSFPESTVLDAVVGRERIVVLWCAASHPVGPLLAELRATQQVTPPAGCVARVVELDKR